MSSRRYSRSTGELSVGDCVYDTDSDSPVAVVIFTPDMSAESWEVKEETTVADMNPGYPSDSDVVIVAFEDDLDEWWSEWREFPDDELFEEVCERGHKFYAFPKPRLEKADGGIACIEHTLRDAGYPVERKEDKVVVEKFGEYVIHPDGSIEGDGALTDRLKTVVERAI